MNNITVKLQELLNVAKALPQIELGGDTSAEDNWIMGLTTEYYNDRVTSVCAKCFQGNQVLTAAYFPKATEVGANAFTNCSRLAHIDIPLVTKINNYSFQYCYALQSVCLPIVTSVGSSAFAGCNSLYIVDIPVVTKFWKWAFSNCSALEALLLRSADSVSELVNADALNNTRIASGTGYIYVPAALVDSYKAATKWSNYAAQFRALEDYTVDGTITGELN